MQVDQRVKFEEAAWGVHVMRAKALGEPEGTPEELFWKQPDGSYGVSMFNAAWWGWRASIQANGGVL